MPTEVILPKVDMDMDKGTIATWHARAGDHVSQGDPLFDIETDKAAMEVEAPASGILAHVIAKEGQDVPVAAAVAWIYAEGEDIPDAAPGTLEAGQDGSSGREPAKAEKDDEVAGSREEPRADAEIRRQPETNAAPSEGAAPSGESRDRSGPADPSGGRSRATPAARRVAQQAGLDLEKIEGTGPRGRIQVADARKARDAGPEEKGARARQTPQAPEPDEAPSPRSAPQRAAPMGPAPLHVSLRKGEDDGAPIVLIHGFAADSTNWAPVEKHLGRERTVMRIDLAAHGKSPRVLCESFSDLVALTLEAFDDLDLSEGAHLVGHSLGGAVAASIADRRPRDVASVLLLNPAGLGADIDHRVLDGILRASRTESLAPWLKRLAATPDAISYDFARAAMAQRSDQELRDVQSALADVLFPDGTQSFDIRDALARLEMPLRIVWGRQDGVIPWRHALEAPSHASLQLLSGVGHIPHVEAPAIVARAIREMIAVAHIGD